MKHAWESLHVLAQRVAPQHGLSRLMHRLARSERPWLARRLIDTLLARYPLNLAEAAESDPAGYTSLNALFTRALRPGVRPLPEDPHAIASPADGVLSMCGRLEGDQLLQAKGRWYSVNRLLALDDPGEFRDGHYATIYLAPHDYHRVHAPCDARIDEVVYIPGALFSVNTLTATRVPDLFARNERVVLRCASERGAFAVVLVGAMLVGSMTVSCCDLAGGGAVRGIRRFPLGPGVPVRQGDELGRFNMGSTVVIVYARDTVEWADIALRSAVRMGQAIGRWRA